MMIEDCYSVFRDMPFRDFDPYLQIQADLFRCHERVGSRRHQPSCLSVNDREGRSREYIIPIQVEGRDISVPEHRIDLTCDVVDENVNNNGRHTGERNHREHQTNSSHNYQGRKESWTGPPVFPGSNLSKGTVSSAITKSESSSSHLSDDIIDLCMYEDMCDSDVYISKGCSGTHSVSGVTPNSETTLVKEVSQTSQKQTSTKVTTPTPSYPVYSYLKSQLSQDGRLIDYIRGDGNCFFRALSKEIYGSEEFHDDVRQAVVDLIEKYSKEFEQFLDSGISITDHINEMRKVSTWASSAEIYAAATLVQRDIYVLSPDHSGEAYHWMLFKPRFMYTRDTSYHPCFITLCHTHGNHYDRITPQYGDCNCDHDPPALSGVQAYVDLTN